MDNPTEKIVIVVDDEKDAREACSLILRREGYAVMTAANADEALLIIETHKPDAVVTDIMMPGKSGIELLKAIKKIDQAIEVVMITGYANVDTAIASIREGAFDYIPKPFGPEELRIVISKALETQDLKNENIALRQKLATPADVELIGKSPAINEVKELVERLSGTNSNILIQGETGTGKEIVARMLHNKSPRAEALFMPVNCAAIPATLLESELFGHERGAFTGAVRRRKGAFELAHKGTIFLDEVGDIPIDLQSKLLRAIQEGEIRPLGGDRNIKVDLGIVSATNRKLVDAVKDGSFREDLFYRLNVIPINMPPLREREGDVRLLAEYFLKKYSTMQGKHIIGISKPAMECLEEYHWPGNVREMENLIERAVILEDGNKLGVEHFNSLTPASKPKAVFHESTPANSEPAGLGQQVMAALNGVEKPENLPTLAEIEHKYILEVLEATKWNRKKASEILGISTVTIWRKTEKS